MEPGIKDDAEKLRFDLIDTRADAEMAAVLTYGAVKYEPNNWRAVDEALDRYFGAIRRHAYARRMGEIIDPDSNLLHAGHILATSHFLCAFDAELLAVPKLEDRLPRSIQLARAAKERRRIANANKALEISKGR